MKNIMPLIFSAVNICAMQQPAIQISNNYVGVTLQEIVSCYKNPVRVMLTEVTYEKDRMADDCLEQYIFKTNGTTKELLKVAAGATVTCRIPIPMLTVGKESRACLLIEDENNTSYNDQYANVWIEKFQDSQECFFNCPKIEGTKTACNPDSLIGVSIELPDKNNLVRGLHYFRQYCVKVSCRIIPKAD